MAPVKYPARDGLTVRGYLTTPAGREAKSLPLVDRPGSKFAKAKKRQQERWKRPFPQSQRLLAFSDSPE